MTSKIQPGDKYGYLTVLYRVENAKNGQTQWMCKCDCGKELIRNGSKMRSGNQISCGCITRNKFIDETGNVYGKLTVLEKAEKPIKNKDRSLYWKCKCECGNITIVNGRDLRQGKTKSCGCGMQENQKNFGKNNFIDETGNQYGRLTVLKEVPNKRGFATWLCQCECGNTCEIEGHLLRNGSIKSCGCLRKESGGHNLINEIGNKYGKLTVIKQVESQSGCATWLCKCDCGNFCEVTGANLRRHAVKSCGCVKSWGEQEIIEFLQNKNINFKKEYWFQDLITEDKHGHPKFDFAIFDDNNNLKFLIEYQGIQHFIDNKNFGKRQRELTDKLKLEYCIKNNIDLKYILYSENIKEKLNTFFS